MASSKKLADRTALVVSKAMSTNMNDHPEEALARALASSPKTAVGQMMGVALFRKEADDKAIAAEVRANELEEKFKGAQPSKLLDPRHVHPSQWANRDVSSFETKEFADLLLEIESAGGNIQAIKVRPKKDCPNEFEIVFGHRRHQACLRLGLPVLAVIEDVSNAELFTQMDRENRQRADLRPYEQGLMYSRALEDGLFPSQRKLGDAIGLTHSIIGTYISIAKLPKEVIAAFNSPLDIQARWGAILEKAIKSDQDAVLARAKVLSSISPKAKSTRVLKSLLGVLPEPSTPKEKTPVEYLGKNGQRGIMSFNPNNGSYKISLKGVNESRMKELDDLIRNFLA